jgi:hypothetical protein
LVGFRKDSGGFWWFSGGGGRALEGNGWSSNGSIRKSILSTELIVETADGHRLKKYRQVRYFASRLSILIIVTLILGLPFQGGLLKIFWLSLNGAFDKSQML